MNGNSEYLIDYKMNRLLQLYTRCTPAFSSVVLQ